MTARTRRTVTVLGALAIISVSSSCGEQGFLDSDKKVRVAIKGDQPGTSYLKDAKPSGMDWRVINSLALNLGVELTERPITSELRETEIVQDNSDLVIATYTITGDREESVDFIGPYMMTHQGFMVDPKVNDFTEVEELSGKRVCTIAGSTAIDNLTNRGITSVTPRPSAKTCIDELKEGKTDAFFTDKVILYGFAEYEQDAGFHILNEDIGIEQGYGIAISKDNPSECKRVQKALEKYVQAGKWEQDFGSSFPQRVADRTKHQPSLGHIQKESCKSSKD